MFLLIETLPKETSIKNVHVSACLCAWVLGDFVFFFTISVLCCILLNRRILDELIIASFLSEMERNLAGKIQTLSLFAKKLAQHMALTNT